MSTSGQPGGAPNIPAVKNGTAQSTTQKSCNHKRVNGVCRLGARCKSQQVGEKKDIPSGSNSISIDVTVADIKMKAKEDISKEARGFAAITLIKTARTHMLSAKEQEGKGNLRAAFTSYIKAATLIKMAYDSPEYIQEAKDKGTAIRMELANFLQNDGRNISGQASAVEEKLKAIEKALTTGSAVVHPPAPKVVKPSSTSVSVSASKSSPPTEPPTSAETNAKKTYNVSNFPVKTVICESWNRNGSCKDGERCRFSHAIQMQNPNLEDVESTSDVQIDSGTSAVSQRGKKAKKGKGRANNDQKQAAQQKHAEEERLAKEKLDQENEAKRAKVEEEEKEKKVKAEQEERERKAKEERERKEKEARKRRETEARAIREAAESERKRREEVQRQERERKVAEEKERKAAEERERKAAEERERKAVEERERREAEARAIREAAERKRKEEAQRQERERKEAEERERKAAEERERKAAEERERKAAEERERREAEARAMREAAERKRKEEAQRQERQRKAAEERQRKEKEAREKREAEARERREEKARKRKEAAQRKKEQKEREEAKKKREQEIEQARIAREKAAREAAKREHLEQMKIRREKEAAAIEQYIVSESSLITCSAGMNIQRVVSGFDLCRITIKNLPNNAKLEEIVDIFTQQGVDASEFFVQQIKPNGTKREAEVLANVDQGQNIAIGLEGIEFRNEHLTFAVSENASWNGMATATQNMPFLTVSWWAPSETVLVTYNSAEQAQQQVQKLNGKTWNGRRIRAMLNDHPNTARGFAIFVATEIKILGCAPGTVHSDGFYTFVETFNVRLLNSANYGLDEIFTDVRDHLRYLHGVQMDSYEVLNDGSQLDAEARIRIGFDDWEDAKRAHDTMDKKRLRAKNFPLLRSWLPKPLQYSIRITRQQYQAQKTQWDELSERKPGRDAFVHTRIGDRGDVFIRVLGQDKKAAGSLKVRVEGMVAGEKLDATHWHPSFGSPRGKIFLNRVLDEKKVYVRSDFKTRCLRVCGEPAMVEEAKQMIREEIERLAGMETARILDAASVRGFMREGLGKLKELIGEDNVSVNVASMPYKVTVKGGIEATHHLQRLMDESRAMGALDTRPGDADREICPICTDDVSNPEQLGCGHTYCSGCLSHFLTSAADSKNFPLVCMGNGGQCRVPIAIPFIRQFLPHQLFENLVEAAFIAYLEQHPQELKYCTTPDCKQIYRRRTDKALLKCPACFATICPMCDEEAHEGMTCEERKIHLDPGLQERLNDELARQQGFKKCPQCSIFIEKTEGCNHMTCKCGAHICWICLGLFTAGTIYHHLNVAHDGHVYDAIPGGANQINAGVDENALMAEQIREIERFERERQAIEARRVPQLIPQPIPRAWPLPRAMRAQPLVDELPAGRLLGLPHAWNQEAEWAQRARRREEEAQAARQREAQRMMLDEAREERRIRENQEYAARLRAAQAQRERLVAEAEEKRRQEERGWCIVM